MESFSELCRFQCPRTLKPGVPGASAAGVVETPSVTLVHSEDPLLAGIDLSDAAAVTQVWSYIGELLFNMLVLVGSVKMSDRIIREMMGL